MSRLSLCAARYPHTSEVHAAGGFHITFYNNIAEETAVRQAAESERDAALAEAERLREELRRLRGE